MQRSLFPTVMQALVILVFITLIVLSPSMQFLPDYIYLHDSQRLIALILLLFILAYHMFNRLWTGNLLPTSKYMRLAFYSLLVLSVISLTQSHYPRHAMIEVSIFSSLCYITLFVAGLFLENKDVFIKQIIYVLWVSILLYMFGFYVGFITAYIAKTPLQWPQPFLGFTNIRLFNQYQLWTIGLITLPLLAFNLKQHTKILLSITLTLWWVLLFYSASRGVLVAWFLGMTVTALFYKKSAWSFLKLQTINAITGYGIYYVLFKILPAVLKQEVITSTILRNSTSDRTELWNICFKMMEAHPLFGVGPLHYFWYTKIGTHPHNSVLQLGAEWGIPATMIILGIAGYGFYCWYKKFNVRAIEVQPKLDSNLIIILFFTIITNAAYSLVDGVIVMPISQVLMFTIIGIMVGQYLHGSVIEVLDNQSQRQLRFRPTFAGVVLVALVWSTLPEIIQGLSGNPKGFSSGPHIVNPRIWVQPRPS